MKKTKKAVKAELKTSKLNQTSRIASNISEEPKNNAKYYIKNI